jgi:hypothetical protein
MSTPQKTRMTHQGEKVSFGLLACGSSGAWRIDIDEATSGADCWRAQIEGPSVYFDFELLSLDIVRKMAKFLKLHSMATKQTSNGSLKRGKVLLIGKDKKTPISLVKDDEYDDRFFLVVGSTDDVLIRFIIAGEDVKKISDALRQVQEDLDEEAQ